jgi:hypothetical protein
MVFVTDAESHRDIRAGASSDTVTAAWEANANPIPDRKKRNRVPRRLLLNFEHILSEDGNFIFSPI